MNPYRSGRRSASVSDWPEIAYFAKQISNILRLVDRGHDPKHWYLERPSMPSLLAYNIRIYSKVEDYETENKTCIDTQIRVRENGSSLDFNFISKLQALVYNILPSTTAVFSYAISPRKLPANEHFFVGVQTVVILLQTTQIISDVCFITDHVAYASSNKTTIVWIKTELFGSSLT